MKCKSKLFRDHQTTNPTKIKLEIDISFKRKVLLKNIIFGCHIDLRKVYETIIFKNVEVVISLF